MSKFKNKKTGEIKEANNFTQLFALSHNSNYELYQEKPVSKPKNTKGKE